MWWKKRERKIFKVRAMHAVSFKGIKRTLIYLSDEVFSSGRVG